jgi:hypothetical protein
MTAAHFREHLDMSIKKVENELARKNTDYADNKEFLYNFYQVAERTGLKPFQVWNVYLQKQLMAVERYVRDGELASEPIESRFMDSIAYLILGWALVKDLAEPVGQSCPVNEDTEKLQTGSISVLEQEESSENADYSRLKTMFTTMKDALTPTS